MWEKVKKLDYEFPQEFDEEARDLVTKILVLDPQQRLGAGNSESPLSPGALRGHAFFASVDWATLWTCPVPELTVGFYIKPPILDSEGNEYDPGAAWDALAVGDGIEWSPDIPLRTPEFIMAPSNPDDIAPHQVVMGPNPTQTNQHLPPVQQRLEDFKFGEATRISPRHERSESPPVRQESISAVESRSASGSSSSEHESSSAGTAESTNLDRDLAALQLNSWFDRLLSDEIAIWTSEVETPRSGLRQRASSIIPSVIPAAVAPRRTHKHTKLVLTSERLLCLKVKENRPPTIKTEIVFDSNKGVMVEKKGDKDFVIHCAGKAHPFSVHDSALASRWVQQINDALDSHRGRRGRRT